MLRTLLLLLLLAPCVLATPIVTNNTADTTAEDSLSVTFFVTDSIGNFVHADSFHVLIFSPTGDSIYAASYIASAPEIRSITLGTTGRRAYRWTESVADIDGPSPRPGAYAGILIAVDTLDGPTTAYLDQGFTFSFLLEPSLAERAKIGDTSNCVTSGTGAFAIDLTVTDSSTGLVMPYANIAVRNLDQSALLALTHSDLTGHATVNLNPGDYVIITDCPGYIFPDIDTITVAGSASHDIFGYHFDPGTPSSPTLCRVYGYVYAIDGSPDSAATITAAIPSGVVRFNNLVISPFARSTTTDPTGYFFVDLIPSDNLTPDGTKYEFTITRRDGTILRHRLKVPDAPSWELTW